MNGISPDVVAIAIPIFSIIGGVVIAIVAIMMGAKKKELRHKERLIAMEKGIELPDDEVKVGRPAYLKNRSGGLVMLFLGVALTVAMWVAGGAIAGVWGLVPAAIGIGLLVSSALERKEVAANEEASHPS